MAAGLRLGHAGLTGWGIILLAASGIATAVGMLLAARRRPAARQTGLRSHRSHRLTQ